MPCSYGKKGSMNEHPGKPMGGPKGPIKGLSQKGGHQNLSGKGYDKSTGTDADEVWGGKKAPKTVDG